MENDDTLFSGLSESERKTVLDCCIEKTIRKKEVIVRQGSSDRDMYIVVSGRLKVSVLSDEGKELSFVVLGKDDYFGELSLIDGHTRSATVSAIEDSELLVLKYHAYQNLLQQHPRTATRFLTRMLLTMASRLRATDAMYQDSVFLDVAARLAKLLLKTSRPSLDAGSKRRLLDIELSQYELGTLISASRESVNKQLSIWESLGIIDVDGNKIALLDLKALQHKAAGL